MDFNLTRLPLLSGLILRAPSSAFDGFPVCWPESLVSVEFPALVVVYMLLLAMGALIKSREIGIFLFNVYMILILF